MPCLRSILLKAKTYKTRRSGKIFGLNPLQRCSQQSHWLHRLLQEPLVTLPLPHQACGIQRWGLNLVGQPALLILLIHTTHHIPILEIFRHEVANGTQLKGSNLDDHSIWIFLNTVLQNGKVVPSFVLSFRSFSHVFLEWILHSPA